MFDGAIGQVVSKLQETGRIDTQAQRQEESETTVARLILGIPDDVVGRDDVIALFGAAYEPGTFMIGETKGLPDFSPVGAKLGYDCWVRQETRNDIQAIKATLAWEARPRVPLDEAALQDTEQEALEFLDYQSRDGHYQTSNDHQTDVRPDAAPRKH